MTAKTIRKASRNALEKMGFTFTWGESAYRCCVHHNGAWIGTFGTEKRLAIPRNQIINVLGLEE